MTSLANMTRNANNQIYDAIEEFDKAMLRYQNHEIDKVTFLDEALVALNKGINNKSLADNVVLKRNFAKCRDEYLKVKQS